MGTIYRNGVPFIGGGGGGTVDTVNGISPDSNKNVQVDVELTQAEYDALPSSKLTDGVNYWIKDGNNNPLNNTVMASGVAYDNTESRLSATNVQGAVDELSGVLMKPVLLWEGDKTGSGSITIDGLSEWMIVAYCNYASNDYILIGSPLRGGLVYGMYDANSTATMGYRFTGNLNSDTITIDSLNRGIYSGSNSTYSSSSTGQSDVHIRRVYGLFRKPQS